MRSSFMIELLSSCQRALHTNEEAPSAASRAMPQRRHLTLCVRCAPLSSFTVSSTCLLPGLLISTSRLMCWPVRCAPLPFFTVCTSLLPGLFIFRWPVFLCLLVFEQRTIRGPDTMSTNQEENVAQQQPGGSDGYSPFKMAGSPYSPFKNGAPEPHHTSHQMSRPDAFAHVVACCAQATRRQNRRRLLRSPLRCGPLGFPRLAARPPAASVGRHEAAARV
jgi:hypothetical protein